MKKAPLPMPRARCGNHLGGRCPARRCADRGTTALPLQLLEQPAGAGRGGRVDLGQCCLAALERREDSVVVAQRVRRAHPYAPGHLVERVDRGCRFAQADGVAVLVQPQGEFRDLDVRSLGGERPPDRVPRGVRLGLGVDTTRRDGGELVPATRCPWSGASGGWTVQRLGLRRDRIRCPKTGTVGRRSPCRGAGLMRSWCEGHRS